MSTPDSQRPQGNKEEAPAFLPSGSGSSSSGSTAPAGSNATLSLSRERLKKAMGQVKAGAAASSDAKAKAKPQVSRPTIAGPRRVRLALTRVQPFSVMKVAFMLSVAMGIMVVVAAAFVWFMLDAMHVFSDIQDLVGTMMDSKSNAFTALLEYMKFSRAISVATVIAVMNVILTTALATIGALLYNVTATLVGGIHLTLADE